MTPLLIAGLVSALLPVLEGADTPQRDAAIDTLGTADVSFHELSEGLGTARWRGRSGILKSVEARGEGAVDFLCRAARDRDHRDVRRLAILALGEVGGTAAADSLLEMLDKSCETDVVIRALGLLGDAVGAPVLQPILTPFLEDARIDVRRQAVVAIGRMAQSGDPEPLIPMLEDAHHSVRVATAEALGAMGPRAGREIRSRYRTLSQLGKHVAQGALGGIGDDPSMQMLLATVCGEEPALAGAAADAIGASGEPSVVPRLETCAQSARHPYVIARLLAAIEQIESRSQSIP